MHQIESIVSTYLVQVTMWSVHGHSALPCHLTYVDLPARAWNQKGDITNQKGNIIYTKTKKDAEAEQRNIENRRWLIPVVE